MARREDRTEALRNHYQSLLPAEFERISRSDLEYFAQTVYDEELRRRATEEHTEDLQSGLVPPTVVSRQEEHLIGSLEEKHFLSVRCFNLYSTHLTYRSADSTGKRTAQSTIDLHEIDPNFVEKMTLNSEFILMSILFALGLGGLVSIIYLLHGERMDNQAIGQLLPWILALCAVSVSSLVGLFSISRKRIVIDFFNAKGKITVRFKLSRDAKKQEETRTFASLLSCQIGDARQSSASTFRFNQR